PDASPTPSPAPQQTLPEVVALPKPSGGDGTGGTGGGDQSALASGTTVLRSLTRTSPHAQRRAVRRSGLGVPRAGEAGLRLELVSAANVTVYARKRIGTKLATVPNARFSIDVSAGAVALRLTTRVGTATLSPGLYRFTVLVRPVKGGSERRDLFVRVVR
ncbi:MAG: hypothetical protein Q7T55_10780, partial [Solirubrobacteraceae bacterium]|nr:hypothetical protein [Solirubrobacteraceae bacterium]